MIRALALVVALALAAPALAAPLLARIDLSEQEMTVFVEGRERHRWPVSTARAGKVTPTGLFMIGTMKRMHYSTIYHGAPMPWSMFFHGNYAIHGTTEVERLGRPASAGCVRLHPDHAERLFKLVLAHGRENTLVEIVR
ncbi:L,D-transpeptidase [Roseovarius salinarum]|uniref:L,D-transpeptidase n=1 Tax=Roseovarius salinarum TaxID=1981892 RepID=UPI000C335FE3|nr:L,D-transpeptidase [Roseovarius salinarum]